MIVRWRESQIADDNAVMLSGFDFVASELA
jgi:hypothetical protein